MVKYAKSREPITIQVVLDLILGANIQASDELIEYRNTKSEYQLTPKQLETYRNFIKTVVTTIKKRDFIVVDEYQSAISYSYYIEFIPKFYDGIEPEIVFGVKFRLSDHYQSNETPITKETESRSENSIIFTSFVVDGVKYDNIVSVISEITQICNDLQAGDYTNLLK